MAFVSKHVIKHVFLVRMLDSGISLCFVLSKVPFQHFHLPPDHFYKKNEPRNLTHILVLFFSFLEQIR